MLVLGVVWLCRERAWPARELWFEDGRGQHETNPIQPAQAQRPPRQQRHAAGNAAPDDGPGRTSLQPQRVDDYVEEAAGEDDDPEQRVYRQRPTDAHEREQQAENQRFGGAHPAGWQGTPACALHHGVDVPVVPHVQRGAAADRQEKTAGDAQDLSPVTCQRAPGAKKTHHAGQQQQSGLVALDQRPVLS